MEQVGSVHALSSFPQDHPWDHSTAKTLTPLFGLILVPGLSLALYPSGDLTKDTPVMPSAHSPLRKQWHK